MKRVFVIFLMVSAAVGAGCDDGSSTSGSGALGGADGGGMRNPPPPPPPSCGSCGADQVCSAGKCVDLPSSCPCPTESYCDLATSKCKVGCLDDTGCATGRICDARACRDGCRNDNACALGQICDATNCHTGCRDDSGCGAGQICDAHLCRAGCRADLDCGASGMVCDRQKLVCLGGCRSNADCGKETLCDPVATMCKPGCTSDAGCNAGRLCDMGQCRAGCRATTSCPVDSVCDMATALCKVGCANGDSSHCALGKACVMFTDGTESCTASCYGTNNCNDSRYDCFESHDWSSITTADDNAARCRLKCSSNSDCPSGYLCQQFGISRTAPNDDYEMLCAKPCTVEDHCAGAAVSTINPTSKCACGADGTCQYPGGSVGCYLTDPSAGI